MQIERGGSPRPIDDFITDSPDGLNWVKIGDAPAQGNYITKTAEKIKPEGLSKTREVHPGDLILSNSMSFGKPYIMGIDGCIHDGWLLIRNTYKAFDLTFLCHLLGTPQMIIQYKSLAAGSTVNNLNKELVGNTVVTIPTIKEQRVLGQYLETLDNLITLHQRKYDKLTNVKKSMLEKMFPQNGSNAPEIRFKGFTEAWEQRKLGEIGSVSMCRRIFKEQTSENGEIPFYKIGTFGGEADAFISRELFEEYKAKYQYPKKGDILISASGSIGRTVVFTGKNEYFQDSNIVWLNHDKHLDNSFLKCFYSIVKWAGIEGSTIKRLYNDNILNTAITLPSVEEQQKIGAYFENLDNLITLHQCKCQIDGYRFQSPLAITWEQRKFGEVFDCTVPNNTLSRAELSYDEGTVLNVHYGDVLIKYGSVLDVQKDDIPRIPHRCREDFNGALLQDGDVIIADTAEDETTGKACEIGNLQGSAIVSGLHTMVCRPRNRMALGYLGYYLNSNAYHYQLLPLMQGIKVLSLSRSNIQKTSVSYPSAMKEQQLIASYFSQLDHLITLHQRKPNFYTGGYYAE